jgi:chemotaxis protein MotB
MAGNAVVRPIIVKKITVEAHGGHHGGAWKVAYADFVTAMMAFFLLMWLLGATTEKQRKSLADYFSPTLVDKKQASAGSNGLFGGDSIVSKDNYPHKAAQTGTQSLTIPKDAKGGPEKGSGATTGRAKDIERFADLKQALIARVRKEANLRRLANSIRLTPTSEGLRIDLIDDADFSMFVIGSDILTPEAHGLIVVVATALKEVPNDIRVRGHTDSSPFMRSPTRNNWQLSGARAEATRRELALAGIDPNRFIRIEGVADREPFDPNHPNDPANRRMSVTLGWSDEGAR